MESSVAFPFPFFSFFFLLSLLSFLDFSSLLACLGGCTASGAEGYPWTMLHISPSGPYDRGGPFGTS